METHCLSKVLTVTGIERLVQLLVDFFRQHRPHVCGRNERMINYLYREVLIDIWDLFSFVGKKVESYVEPNGV